MLCESHVLICSGVTLSWHTWDPGCAPCGTPGICVLFPSARHRGGGSSHRRDGSGLPEAEAPGVYKHCALDAPAGSGPPHVHCSEQLRLSYCCLERTIWKLAVSFTQTVEKPKHKPGTLSGRWLPADESPSVTRAVTCSSRKQGVPVVLGHQSFACGSRLVPGT